MRLIGMVLVLGMVAAVSFSSGCDQDQQVRGQLILTFQTDMALPDQIDTVLVQVTRSGGQVLHMDEYPLGSSRNDRNVPGTFALVAGDSREPFTITVAGRKNEEWRTYREVITTVPHDRVAELRMPFQWLCNEAAKPETESLPDGKGGVVSRVVQTCAKGMTCKAGTCESSDVDSEMLPEFKPAQLFGGAEDPKQGECFDVMECMASGSEVVPDGNCTIASPGGDNVNVALRVAGGGICNVRGPTTTCFVPLDGNSAEGWTVTNDGMRLQLPKAVCKRRDEHKVLAVQTSTACRTKDPSLPTCGAWSSVPDTRAVVPDPSAMIASWPSPELFANLSADNAVACCPLMSEEGSLYTCICTDDSTKATVYGIDMQTAQKSTFALDIKPMMAATVFKQTLYWAGGDDLFQFPLQPGAAPTSTKALGGLYTEGVLLSDENGVYSLTSGLGTTDMPTSKVVQLLHFAANGDVKYMDPLGNSAVMPIAQDATSFYAGMNEDKRQPDGMPFPEGTPFERTSRVVRIDKTSHQLTTLLKPQTMTISSLGFNGYLAVVSDGTDVFALFETPPAAGFERLQIGRISQAATAAESDLTPIYDLSVSAEHHLTRLQLLGAIDGAVFFSREEWIQIDDARQTLRSSSVMLIPKGSSSARFIADFTNDKPSPGVFASGQQVFWLNRSGRIFSLSREALAP